MSIEVIKTIKIETASADKSVKDLRKEISTLRDSLLNLQKGTQEYDDTLNKIIQDETQLTQVMKAGKDEVAQALKKVTGEYVTQKQELKALKVELEQLQPGTDAYNEKFSRAAEITKNLRKQNEMLKYSSTDLGDQLSNMRGIAANMAAGFSAAQAAIGLFGGETEEVQKAMLKVQQAMALVQGLQGLAGFKDRTEGLSTALKNWLKGTKEVTVATNTLSTAEKANAVATNAEKVATEGATKAQKGLNAAIKANPIGFILGLLALLVANWKKVVEWIGKAVGGFDNLTKAMNKVKATIAGVANAISKVLLVPIKEAINYAKTLGKVMIDIFTLKWGKIGDDFKEGVNNAVDIVKDGYNVAANYAAGKEKEITKQTQAEIKKRAEARADELDKAIQLKEADHDADWKYTEEGKAMYKEYFDALEQMYKNDKNKYFEYQLEKKRYDKGLSDYKDKVDKDAEKKEEERRKKAEEAAKKAKDKLLKIEQDYQSKVASKVGSTYTSSFDELKESLSAFSEYYKSISSSLSDSSSKTLKKWASDIDTFLNNSTTKLKVFANETASVMFGFSPEEIKSVINPEYFKANFEDALGNLLPEEEIKEKWKSMVNSMTEVMEKDGKTIVSPRFVDAIQMKMDVELQRLSKLSSAKLNDALENSSDEVNRKINDEIIKIFQKNIKPTVDEQITKLQLEIDKKTIKLDFEIETGLDFDSFNKKDSEFIPIKNFDKKTAEFERAATIFNNSLEQIRAQLNYYQQTVDYVNSKPELIPSDEYENALRMIEQLTNQAEQLKVDYYNTQAEIRDRYFAEDIQKIRDNAAQELNAVDDKYNKLYVEGNDYVQRKLSQTGILKMKELEYFEESYQIQKQTLEKELLMWEGYLEQLNITADQRVEAERMVAELTAEIENGAVEHTIEANRKREDSWQQLYSMIQQTTNDVGKLMGSIADIYEADLKYQVDHNNKSQEEAEDYYEKTIKPMRIAEVVVNTIAGAIGSFLQASGTYPPPYGQIIGGISAAAVAAAGVAQIASIKNQKFGSSNTSSNIAVSTPETEVYKPDYVENPTSDNEVSNLRNAYMEQPIKAYVVESEITDAQRVSDTRGREASF